MILAKAASKETPLIVESLWDRFARFPWWLVAIILVLIGSAYFVATNESYQASLLFIVQGISITVQTTLYAYALALVIGLIMGLGRVSRNVVFSNVARFYVEVVRGIPMLVLIFYIAFVAVVDFAGFFGIAGRDVPMNVRAIIALAVTYGAFLAEIFRAGIQSIDRGQMEAARSLGMSYTKAMRYVILPQAIRNVLPALGNDFVAMLKDSSLVSVLAVRDITQVARLHAGSTFRFREAYTVLAVLYLSMTLVLSALVQWLERRLHAGRK
ncbi:MAG: amino acid ABC transporter permease [Anaerolineales bacterium]|nr:amino acid ABC transporter permease [Anaerolineales bacterium]MCW5854564.1 amino acid ABC transporter permease [Anaerolineales bacterium]